MSPTRVSLMARSPHSGTVHQVSVEAAFAALPAGLPAGLVLPPEAQARVLCTRREATDWIVVGPAARSSICH